MHTNNTFLRCDREGKQEGGGNHFTSTRKGQRIGGRKTSTWAYTQEREKNYIHTHQTDIRPCDLKIERRVALHNRNRQEEQKHTYTR